MARRIPAGTRELPEYRSTFQEVYERLDREQEEREERQAGRGFGYGSQLRPWQGGQ